jgi:type IV fimbrial biogenesis protein FimT
MRPRLSSGFTLIELMITLAVVVVLVTIAIPSFRDLLARNELTTTTNAWVGAITAARAEAVKRNQTVVLCGEDGKSSAGIGSNCSAALAGQVRYISRITGSAEILHAALAGSIGNSLELVSSTTVRFRGDGVGYLGDDMLTPYDTGSGGAPSVVVLCSSALSNDNVRRVQLFAGSTVQVARDTQASCP